MIYDLNEIAMLPDTFSLEDLRVVCHISKRTARYYLRAGLIPCEISEKKTHCYTIRKYKLKLFQFIFDKPSISVAICAMSLDP